VALARQWFDFNENLGNTVADIFGVHPFQSSRRASYCLMHFPNELLTAFVPLEFAMIIANYTKKTMLHGASQLSIVLQFSCPAHHGARCG
jgi:hypothetical protein